MVRGGVHLSVRLLLFTVIKNICTKSENKKPFYFCFYL